MKLKNLCFTALAAYSLGGTNTTYGAAKIIDAARATFYAAQRYNLSPEFNKFTKKFGFSQAGEMGQLIADYTADPRCNQTLKRGYFGQVKELPTIYIKGTDIKRVINAARMKRCIEVNQLHLLAVPQKCVGYVNGEWKVFAEAVPYHSKQPSISLELVKQITKFSEETGFRDWLGNNLDGNWKWNKAGKFVCLDTEDRSFTGEYNKERSVSHLLKLYSNYMYMDSEATAWLENRIHELQNSPENSQICTPLPRNTHYDAALKINFEKALEEFVRWNS